MARSRPQIKSFADLADHLRPEGALYRSPFENAAGKKSYQYHYQQDKVFLGYLQPDHEGKYIWENQERHVPEHYLRWTLPHYSTESLWETKYTLIGLSAYEEDLHSNWVIQKITQLEPKDWRKNNGKMITVDFKILEQALAKNAHLPHLICCTNQYNLNIVVEDIA